MRYHDDDGISPRLLSTRTFTARKDHKYCAECGKVIRIGEQYSRQFGLVDR